MPASSRKRNKGKERKARKEENNRADANRFWRELCSSSECDHGYEMVIPADDHPVSTFMDQYIMNLDKRSENLDLLVSETLKESFISQTQVWNNESHRKLVIDLLVNIGTNALLYEGLNPNLPACIATSILVLEHYNGTNDLALILDKQVVISKRRDIDTISSSIRRDLLKFYRKTTTCKCLKKMHLEARKTLPKTGVCVYCKAERERTALLLCSRCMVFQYCSRECQVADWPAHERNCGILVYQNQQKAEGDRLQNKK